MSDVGFIFSEEPFSDEVDFDAYEAEKKTERKYWVVIAICILLSLVLFAEFVVYKFIKPSLASPKVTVSGERNYTAEEIAMKLLPLNTRNWFTFDVNKAASILSSDPCISDVEVVKRFPDKIYVKISERVPVAMTLVSDGGKSMPMQIDSSGVMFFPKNNGGIDFASLPIISGIPVEHLTSGMRIPSKYKVLIDQVSSIQKLPQKYFSVISEICVVPKENGSYELMVIPSSSHIKVLTDRALNEDALKYMMIVLDVVKDLDSDVREVDLRYGAVSYR